MEQTLLAISEANTRQTSLVRPFGETGGGGRVRVLFVLKVFSSTTHPFRDEEPFLLLMEKPSALQRSSRFSSYIAETVFFRGHLKLRT